MQDAVTPLIQPWPVGVNQAARVFGVSKGALINRTENRVTLDAHVGRSMALSANEVMAPVKCIKILGDWGWGFTKQEVEDVVGEFVSSVDDHNFPFRLYTPGRDWLDQVDGFLTRHPDVVPRKTEQISIARLKSPGCFSDRALV